MSPGDPKKARTLGDHVPTLGAESPVTRPEKRTAFETDLVHAGFARDETTGAVVPPIHFTTTYGQRAPGDHQGFEYSRTGNPTRRVFERAMAEVEAGARGFAFASGMAATDALLRLVKPGDHVVASSNLYGGTHRLFSQILTHYGVTFDYVDTRDPANLEKALTPATRMVFLETPTNPNLYLTDIEACVQVVRAHEASHGDPVMVVVDNTFATPYNQRPLLLGADAVLHSVTKYIGGHSDVLGGALVVKDPEVGEKLHFLQNAIGGIMDPFSAYMAHRGLKTLHVRMEHQGRNAQAIAEYLDDHPKVATVWYPGLPDNPQHALAEKQMRTPGAMVSFEVKGGYDAGLTMMKSVELWTLAESLGAVESLVDHPASMTHGAIPKEEREASGLSDGLIRLSVGIEAVDDLLADLDRALDKV